MQTNKRKYMKCEKTLDHLFDCCLFFVSQDLGRMIAKLADEAFAPTTLSPSYAILMMAVKEKGEINCSALAFCLKLSPSTITRFVDKLLIKGFLQRQQDGKNSNVKLSRKGEEIMPKIYDAWEVFHQEYCKILGEDFSKNLTQDMLKANHLIREEKPSF